MLGIISRVRKNRARAQDHISKMEKNRASPGYIDCTMKAIRSWLNHNEIELKRRIKITNRDFTPTLQNERVPTKEELQYLLVHSDDRAKVAMSLVAMSGLRLETLGTYNASDGLTISDLPEIRVEGKGISFIKDSNSCHGKKRSKQNQP